MTLASPSPDTARTPYLVTAAIALLWLVVAWVRPGTTLHLGPLLVPLMPALVASGDTDTRKATLAGAVVALTALLVLAVSGHLDGPALRPFASAGAESVAFLVAGTVLGLAFGGVSPRRSRREPSGPAR